MNEYTRLMLHPDDVNTTRPEVLPRSLDERLVVWRVLVSVAIVLATVLSCGRCWCSFKKVGVQSSEICSDEEFKAVVTPIATPGGSIVALERRRKMQRQ